MYGRTIDVHIHSPGCEGTIFPIHNEKYTSQTAQGVQTTRPRKVTAVQALFLPDKREKKGTRCDTPQQKWQEGRYRSSEIQQLYSSL